MLIAMLVRTTPGGKKVERPHSWWDEALYQSDIESVDVGGTAHPQKEGYPN